jgi:hypothetical protein
LSVAPDSNFPRDWRVRVQFTDAQALDVSALDLEFKILRSLKPSPNRAVITLWNLNPDHRAALLRRNKPTPNGQPVPINVQVEAGYKGRRTVLLSADLREVASRREGTDWKTLISMDDGGAAVRAARFPKGGVQFTAGTPVGQVLRQACAALGVGLGNARNFEATAEVFGWGRAIPHTMTLTGSAFDGLKRVTDSIGVNFSIQGGVLQLLPKGQPLQTTAVLLSPDTGLLDSPEAAIDSTVSLGFAKTATGKPSTPNPPTPKNTSILKCKAMLIPGLVPGAVVKLDAASYKGLYEISEVEYVGQSWGKDWMAVMVLRNY